MTTKQKRTVLSLSALAAILAVAVGLVSLYHLGYAHAQGSGSALVDAGVGSATPAPAAAPPVLTIDPAHPLDSAGGAWKLVTDQGWVWGGLCVLLAVGTFLAKKNDEDHWIHTPWLPSGLTAFLTSLGAILNAHFGSASWASALALIMGSILLLWKKPDPAKA